MREIKFKVWDKKKSNWIKQEDIAINQKGLLFIRYEGQVSFSSISLTKSTQYDICFYTGHKDKNSTEIYADDIVRIYYDDGYTEAMFVKYDNIKMGYCFVDKYGDEYKVTNTPIEVIGDTYKNMDLLL